MKMDAKDYGLPQSRPRVYMWGVLESENANLNHIKAMAAACKSKRVPLDNLLSMSFKDAVKAPVKRDGAKWKTQISELCHKYAVQVNDCKEHAKAFDHLGMSERGKTIVAMQELKLMKAGVTQDKFFLIQFDQNPSRADNVSELNFHIAPCMTPGGRYVKLPAKDRIGQSLA